MKDKRILRRPWGRQLKGGWVIQPDELLKALKDGDVAEFGKLRVGSKQLAELVRLMRFPDQELLIRSNGLLEVENIARILKESKEGHYRTHFRKPRLSHSFRVDNNAWIGKSAKPVVTVIIRPRKF